MNENDVLFCIWQIQLIDNSTTGELEEVYKVVEDGLAYCHVGYFPKRLFWKFGPKLFDKMFVHLLEDYGISNNSHEQSWSSFLWNGIRKDHTR
jgi:hypothetical protein